MKDLKTLAEAAGLSPTRKGNLELGSDAQGHCGQPGSGITCAAVTFYALADGDFLAVVDNRHGSIQGGYFDQHGGEKVHLTAAGIGDAIDLAAGHIADLDGDTSALRRAHRVAASEAMATWRKLNRAAEAQSQS